MSLDESSVVVPLPFARQTEYLCQTEDGTLVYVSADKHNYSYESFRLFVGDGLLMREIPIEHVERFRDGGTTCVYTTEGRTFFSPSPSNARRDPKLVPKWDEEDLASLDRDAYDIVETPEGVVTITKKG